MTFDDASSPTASATFGQAGVYVLRLTGDDTELQTFDEITVTINVPADFDGDFDVDGADFLRWQQGYPMSSGATRADGDTDVDGDVDGQDFLVWQQWYPYP